MLFGTYFFLDNEMIIHTRQAATIWSILADFGGLLDLFFIVLCFFVVPLNEEIQMNKFMQILYTRESNEVGKLLKSVTKKTFVQGSKFFVKA